MTGTFRTLTSQSSDVFTLRIDIPLAYVPGQAVKITFPGDAKARFFSISSSPTEGRHIDITVKAETGSGLARSIASLKRGDAIPVEGPFGGALAVPTPVPEHLCFIAAGTGVTPFRSMIKSLLDTGAAAELWLLHSVKTQRDLVFHDEFSTWSGTQKNFHYVPTLTRDTDNNWKNETGRISHLLIRKHLQDCPAVYALCGPSSFVADMDALLRGTLHVGADRILREKW